jgi:hypothetical protein
MLPKPTPDLASVFFALGDRTRVQLIAMFAQAESCPRADGGSSDLRNSDPSARCRRSSQPNATGAYIAA